MNIYSEFTERDRYFDEILEFIGLTIPEMICNWEKITVSSVAARCGLSRSFFYRHPEVKKGKEFYRTNGMSKEDLRQEVVRLRDLVRFLERRLYYVQK